MGVALFFEEMDDLFLLVTQSGQEENIVIRQKKKEAGHKTLCEAVF